MTRVISENYRELNRKLHEDRPDYGSGHSSRTWYPAIEALAKQMEAGAILDYGAGKCAFAKSHPHLIVQNYEPSNPALADAPEPCDLVICTDVLEHVEPDCLDAVLDDIQRCALKGAFLTIATRQASKTLADGRNAHLIQKPADWWIPKLMARWDMRSFHAGDGEFVFFGQAIPQEQKVAA